METSRDTSFDTVGMSPLTQFMFGAGLIVVFLLVSKLYLDQYLEIRRLETKLGIEQGRAREYQQQIESLQSEIDLLKTDKGMEILARGKLKFIQNEEILVVPVKKPPPPK